ncbi:hypothetical protein D6777_03380 [Candidatus Woesearchaeota archaeon]|nr:MAG: hypothetical protein D6777_03380 [Candidatus Woesearchaeota archaeon]
MKIYFKPKTKLGKWSIRLIVIMPILLFSGMSFVSFYESIPAGKIIMQDIILRPLVALPMLGGIFSGIASFFCGIFGIIRKKDYSILVFLSSLIGFFVLLFILGEFFFPH